MKTFNQVTLVGYIGFVKYTQKDTSLSRKDISLLRLRIATDEEYKKDNETVVNTTWHTVKFWNGRAEALSKILKQGMLVFVSGSLESYQVDDKEIISIRGKEIIIMQKNQQVVNKTDEYEELENNILDSNF